MINASATAFCNQFGVSYPIVQTGMGWVAGAKLTAATSHAGGLGILASATMSLDELEQAITKVKERTDKPFGVNMLPQQADISERIDLMSQHGVTVASFAGAPGTELVALLKEREILSMVTVGAKRHAEKMAAIGVDCVIAQGGEGGGHTGSVPTSLLLPAVCDAARAHNESGDGNPMSVLGAGGFYDGRGLVAALAYGAHGIAMGTRFLLTQESQVPDNIKKTYLETAVTATVVTSAIDGAPQRVIRTPFIESLMKTPLRSVPAAISNAAKFSKQSGQSLKELLIVGNNMKNAQDLTIAQTALAANAPMMTKASMVDGRIDVGILPTGQVVGEIGEIPTVAELISRIMVDAEATIASLSPS